MEALIRGRRSVRFYKTEPVAPATIAEMLAIVANAPTGKNNRLCLFTVIEDQESMDILRRDTMEGLRRAVAEKRLGEGGRAIFAMWSRLGIRAGISSFVTRRIS